MSRSVTSRATSRSGLSTAEPIEWHCHCCTAKNDENAKKCRVCGRPETYAQQGYHLPYHGQNAKLYRPSQMLTVLDNIHEVDGEGWSSLHSACANGNSEIVKQLLMYKSKIEALTVKRQTPLHLAVFSGSLECVTLLVKSGANVNVETLEERKTPLHMACESGFALIAQLLIQHGGNIHAKNILERTALHCVAVSGRTDLAILLLRAGAKYNTMDVHGWNPQQIAELFGHVEFQELMIRQGMTIKQAVFKELPPAPWHSELWSNVVRMQAQRTEEHGEEVRRQAEHDGRMEQMRLERVEAVKQAKRDERQAELREYHRNKASTILQEARLLQQLQDRAMVEVVSSIKGGGGGRPPLVPSSSGGGGNGAAGWEGRLIGTAADSHATPTVTTPPLAITNEESTFKPVSRVGSKTGDKLQLLSTHTPPLHSAIHTAPHNVKGKITPNVSFQDLVGSPAGRSSGTHTPAALSRQSSGAKLRSDSVDSLRGIEF